MKTLYRRAFLVLAFVLAVPLLAHAQNVDNKGDEFLLPFLPNFDSGAITELHLTSDAPTQVTIEYPVNSPTFTTTVSVAPGNITIVEIPNTSSQGWNLGVVDNNSVRAFADDPFIAYMVNRRDASTDAALALPIDALNTRYYVMAYEPRFVGTEFGIVAPFNDTEVTITPTNDLIGGYSGGTAFTVDLDRGDGFLGRSTGSSGSGNELIGTLIESSKPIAMTNGNGCTQVPPGTTACDHIFEFAHPVQSWGTETAAAPLPQRPSGSPYRVLASEDNTTIERNGNPLATLNAGEFIDTGVLTGAQVFSADKPIFAVQFMTGISFSGATGGDPAMGNLIPTDQFLRNYTFSTVGGSQFMTNFVSILASNADAAGGNVLLDGTAIPASEFTAIAGTGLSFTTQVLTEGTHTTSSNDPHGITVEGYDSADSYIFPGGALFDFINPIVDNNPPVCEGSLGGFTFTGSVSDDSDPDDTGVFFVQLAEASTNLTLDVDDFDPGDSPVNFTVMLTDANQSGSGAVIGTDGSGNTCSIDVDISVDVGECDVPTLADNIVDETARTVSNTISDQDGIAGFTFSTLNNFTVASIAPMAGFTRSGDTWTWTDSGPAPTSVDFTLQAGPSGEALYFLEVTDACADPGPNTTDFDPPFDLGVSPDLTFALDGSYPNPTRGSATVSFSLGETSPVTLAVYNVMGRKVATLVDAPVEAGQHEVRWNGRSADGSAVASGVYLLRLEAGDRVATRRLTVVR
jgi:hypothetical protein